MGFLNPGPDDEYRIASQAQNGTTEVPGAGTLEGALTAIPKGIASGAEKIGDLMSEIGGAVDPAGTDQARMADGGTIGVYGENLPGQSDTPSWHNPTPSWNYFPSQASLTDAVPAARLVSDWSATGLDPRDTGTLGRILASTTENMTVGAAGAAVGGPWGAAALLGPTEGYSDYLQNKQDGLDDDTALEKSALTGVLAAGSALIPMKLGTGTTSAIALPAISNVLTGAAQRASTAAVLDANGYHDMARQYRVFDGESMAADVLLGAAFGLHGALFHDGRPEAGAINPADVDAALATSSEDHFNRSSPGIPTRPDVANDHVDVMHAAIASLARGDEPNVSSDIAQSMVDNTVPDPNHETLGMLNEAARSELNNYDDAIKPIDAVEPPAREPIATAEPGGDVEGAANDDDFGRPTIEPSEPLDAMTKYRVDALLADPRIDGMFFRQPDGSEISGRSVLQNMAQERADMDKLAQAHEIAAACFISSGGAA